MSGLAGNFKNDIYLDADGDIAWFTDLDAVRDDCETAMKAQLGEMVLSLDTGVPTLDTVWSQWKPLQFEAAARAMLLTVPNVSAVKTFNITRNAGVATYVAQIQTTFGSTTVSGSFVQ